MVVSVILYKNNAEYFKEFKQYSYLWLISAFSILILTIEMLSWTTECFFPFADFFFRNFNQRYKHPAFGEFYSILLDGEFYASIQDFSRFLFCFSLSIQYFIYLVFDKSSNMDMKIKKNVFLTVLLMLIIQHYTLKIFHYI